MQDIATVSEITEAQTPSSRSWSRAVGDLTAGWRQRQLWGHLGWQDIKQGYRRSVIGPFWITISVGLLFLALGAVYGHLFRSDPRTYLPYLALGLVLWTFLSTCLLESCQVFQEQQAIIKQIKVPYSVHLLRVLWRNLIVLLHTAVIVVPLFLFLDIAPGTTALLAAPGLVLVGVNLFWMGLLLAITGARYRDAYPIVAAAIQVAFFVTPVMWPASLLTTNGWVAQANPLHHLIQVVRGPLLGEAPPLTTWAIASALAVAGTLMVVLLFRRVLRQIIYWL
jgi:ABC-type polysaccharide/polyol phosphate export permease